MSQDGDGEERMISAIYSVGGALSDTCPQWGMGRRGGYVLCTQWRTLSAMYVVTDTH